MTSSEYAISYNQQEQQHNHTGLILEQGGQYQFGVENQTQKWKDASIKCDADDWNNKTVEKECMAEAGFKFMEPFRRAPRKWVLPL